MYISKIKLWNFRKFGSTEGFDLAKPNLTLPLEKGTNVLIGKNDAGKTAIIDAIRLVTGTHSLDWNRVTSEDFFDNAHRLRIELSFSGLSEDEAKNFIEWLSWEKDEESELLTTLRIIVDVRRSENRTFPYEIRAGADERGSVLSAEAREYLKSTYLKPLRDAEAELVPRRNSRLSRIFQGHSAFKGDDEGHHLVTLFSRFNEEIRSYFHGKNVEGQTLADEGGKELKTQVDQFIQAFYHPDAESSIDVSDGSLKTILESLMLVIDGNRNPGLGTLNRLFMAAELVHLSKPKWSGSRTALIEELEAHLHPQAQMKIIEDLSKRKELQLILTTHSPNLTSKLPLKSLILCEGANVFPLGEQYTKLENDDYTFLECFLDVTKSNLLFANGVIFVEGWSEELIVPTLAKVLKTKGIIAQDLTEAGVSVINVGGTAFSRYAKIFLRNNEPRMETPVAVITDLDIPEYKKDDSGNYVKSEAAEVAAKKQTKLNDKESSINDTPVKAFIAPHWTLEYSLLTSEALKDCFKNAFKAAHPQADTDNLEEEVAKKLLNKGLKKKEIAYLMAKKMEADLSQFDLTDTGGATYLIEAIKYACGN